VTRILIEVLVKEHNLGHQILDDEGFKVTVSRESTVSGLKGIPSDMT